MEAKNLEQNWHSYIEAYNSSDDQARKKLLESSVSETVAFTNPGGEGQGRAALIAHIQQFRTKMPGVYFRTEKVFVHHGELLAVWSMHKPDGTKVATGYNFVRSENGFFSYMGGFF